MANLKWLEKWYADNCNGEWEHLYGIEIDTLDNPGWVVRIDLTDTDFEKESFAEIKINRSESDWCYCCVKESKFEGVGGVFNLEEILDVFCKWVEEKKDKTSTQ